MDMLQEAFCQVLSELDKTKPKVLDIIYKPKSCIIEIFYKGIRHFLVNFDLIMHMHDGFSKLHMVC